MENDTKRLAVGKCPVCGLGQIVETAGGFACYAGMLPDGRKCGFRIFRRIHGVDITAPLVARLITEGQTEELPMRNAIGQPFLARFVLRGDKVDVKMSAHMLRGRCPVCGGRVLRTSKGYACEYSLQKSPLCRFQVTGFIHGRKINEEEMEDFLEGKAGVLDGFTTADGKMFSSVLTFRDNGLVGLDPRITTCPSCGGNILVSPVAYNCSNYGNQEHPCRFSLWRNIAGHEVTAEEMRQICEEGATRSPIDFYKHNGVIFRQRLALNADRTKVIKQ